MLAMTLARLALLFAIYVSLDVSNPLMPGALTFSVQESVEVRQSDRVRGEDDAALTLVAGAERLAPSETSVTLFRPAPPVTVRSRPPHIARSHLSPPKSASPSEDH
jgi:hypothetical protein